MANPESFLEELDQILGPATEMRGVELHIAEPKDRWLREAGNIIGTSTATTDLLNQAAGYAGLQQLACKHGMQMVGQTLSGEACELPTVVRGYTRMSGDRERHVALAPDNAALLTWAEARGLEADTVVGHGIRILGKLALLPQGSCVAVFDAHGLWMKLRGITEKVDLSAASRLE